jgi:hypothetical protein
MPPGTTTAQKGKEGADAGGRSGRRRKDAVEEWGREKKKRGGRQKELFWGGERVVGLSPFFSLNY